MKQIYYIRGSGLADHVGTVAAFVYQTGGNAYWLQPNLTVAAGAGVIGAAMTTPWVSIGDLTPGQLAAGLTTALQLMNLTTANIPVQVGKLLNTNLRFNAQQCWINEWNGTYTSSVKRRV